ncbi:unnamed protein product [Pleuronectes platessa]|uniref:Uncharacterized protein n=1 Tax=Pleuronectes platessa TaxID=8262 RepID=A0A9N7UC41_PLEPL|nr:unnamed protein product [Pleuronectes platessa]
MEILSSRLASVQTLTSSITPPTPPQALEETKDRGLENKRPSGSAGHVQLGGDPEVTGGTHVPSGLGRLGYSTWTTMDQWSFGCSGKQISFLFPHPSFLSLLRLTSFPLLFCFNLSFPLPPTFPPSFLPPLTL